MGDYAERASQGHDSKSHISGKTGKSKKSDLNKSQAEMNKTGMDNANFKFEIPESCFFTVPRKNKIEKLDGKFILAAHPLPSMEG